MRKLLNTLYITTPNAYISKDGLNIVVSVNQNELFRIPSINIESIITFGYMGVSSGAMKLCSESGISLTFMTPQGRYISRISGPVKGNVFLRKHQYSLADDQEWSLAIAQMFIAGKIQNYRNVLRRHIRDYGDNDDVLCAINALESCKKHLFRSSDKLALLGFEGQASNAYFSVFNNLILNSNSGFPFNCRNRRPPKDAVNAMLSFAYTLLTNDITSALESVGLDPYVGFFHTLRPGRTSLALDMIEEFRAYLCDRFVLSLINKKQVNPSDFLAQGDNGVVMTDNCRKIFLTQWQKRKRETIIHPYLNEKVEIGLLPYIQASLLARFIRDELDNYPVFLMK